MLGSLRIGVTAAAIVLLAGVSEAVVFSVDFTFTGQDFTSVTGTIETTQTGTFSSEDDIENFFNNSTYNILGVNGMTTIYNLTNANSAWDLRFGDAGGPVAATVISSPSKITIDFSTPNETSGVDLGLISNPFRDSLWFQQSNNITDSNRVVADSNAMLLGINTLPFDSEFTFTAIPEPTPVTLGLTGLVALIAFRRIRAHRV